MGFVTGQSRSHFSAVRADEQALPFYHSARLPSGNLNESAPVEQQLAVSPEQRRALAIFEAHLRSGKFATVKSPAGRLSFEIEREGCNVLVAVMGKTKVPGNWRELLDLTFRNGAPFCGRDHRKPFTRRAPEVAPIKWRLTLQVLERALEESDVKRKQNSSLDRGEREVRALNAAAPVLSGYSLPRRRISKERGLLAR